MFFDLFSPFLIGFLGSLHCLGMCGPLILAYSFHIKSPSGRQVTTGASPARAGLLHHLSFHAGRLLSYGFLGALAATLFHAADLRLLFMDLRGGMTLLGGCFMIFMGGVLLKILPLPGFLSAPLTSHGSFWGRVFPPLFQSSRLTSKMALGLLTGFLPCGLSWAMIGKAATTQNIPAGFFTMVAFGLGTVPLLFFTGVSASFLSLKTRLVGERIAALAVIAMGLILVFKGGRIFV